MNSGNISKEEELKQIKSKNKFDNLKSNYFLCKIFDIIKRNKSLEIIKVNKKLQKRLNMGINDYKEYSQLYSSIEIELKLCEKESNKESDKFINISNKEEESYYHIYFNDNKNEIKRNYLTENDNITKIKIIIDYQIKSFENLFKDCKINESIIFKKFYRNNINNMSHMFSWCSSLKILNLSNFNTRKVTKMDNMFALCSSLKDLELSNFNTSNVTIMNTMFLGCSSLKKLNLSNFNTFNVINMAGMFYECSSLKELDIFNFNTFNVIDMSYMFYGCSSLNI